MEESERLKAEKELRQAEEEMRRAEADMKAHVEAKERQEQAQRSTQQRSVW